MAKAPGPTGREALRRFRELDQDPLAYLSSLANQYGDLLRLPLPRGQAFVVSRPELAGHVLVGNQANYTKARTYLPLTELLGNGLLTNEGEHWVKQRRLVQPMFSRRRIDAFAPAMTGAASRTLDGWAARPAGSTVDVAAAMNALTLDVVGRALFSSDLTGHAAAVAPALAVALEMFEKVVSNPLFMLVPNFHRWPTPSRLRSRGSEKVLRDVVDGMITARRTQGGQHGQEDLLDMLLAARDADSGEPMPEQQIRDELMTFMLAGHETTSTALSWTLMLLSQHPRARERLEAEVDQLLSGRLPTAEDAGKLEWTTAVLEESMRLYPPAWMFEREAQADDELDGVPVPAGSIVATPPYLIHRNRQHWPNPEGFEPERFLPGAGAGRHRLAYLPFGAGRRICVGSGFAMLEATLLLAAIVQRFRLDLAPGYRPALNPTVTLRPDGPMPMSLYP
ncbi:MAG: cytochrome P450, partial [Thermocrispum sp.]